MPVQGEALIDQPGPVEPEVPTGADRAREALAAARGVQADVEATFPVQQEAWEIMDQAPADEVLRAVGRIADEMDVPHGPGCSLAEPCAECRRYVGESGPESITLEQARQLWPDRVVVEGDGSWSVEAITVRGGHGPGASSEGGNQDTPIVTSDADPGQSPERCAACDVRLTDGESLFCSDCVEAPPVVPGGPDVMVPHECEAAPDQVFFCRHCGADLMTVEPDVCTVCLGEIVYRRTPLVPGSGIWQHAVDPDDPDDDHRVGVRWNPQGVSLIDAPWVSTLADRAPIRITLPGVYDLTAEQYHDVNVTGEWLSNSDVKKILQTCPAQFQYDRWNGVRKTSDAFDWGHVWHARVLGKGEAYRVFEPKKLDGRTKEGKAQRAEVDAARAAGITPIYGDQFALIEDMAQAIEADPIAIGLMSAPGRQEVCLFWTETIKVTNPQNSLYGQMVTVKRRAMIDHLPDMPDDPTATVVLVDGKTADEVKPDDQMRKKIYDYGYHRQADTYAAGVEALFNRAAEVVFLFQSKKPPHLIVPVDLDTPAMLVAAAQNRQAMEVWAECVETGVWPGYTKGIATSGVPAWIERQFEDELVIG